MTVSQDTASAFVERVLKPVAERTDAGTSYRHRRNVIALLFLTAITESNLRPCIQYNGPALGMFQVEPATFMDLQTNWLQSRPAERAMLDEITAVNLVRWPKSALIFDPWYGAMVARFIYRRAAPPLPDWENPVDVAAYWKNHYNTLLGKGETRKAVQRSKPYWTIISDCYIS